MSSAIRIPSSRGDAPEFDAATNSDPLVSDTIDQAHLEAEQQLDRLIGRQVSSLAIANHWATTDILDALQFLGRDDHADDRNKSDQATQNFVDEETAVAIKTISEAASALDETARCFMDAARLSRSQSLRWSPRRLFDLVNTITRASRPPGAELVITSPTDVIHHVGMPPRPLLSAITDAICQTNALGLGEDGFALELLFEPFHATGRLAILGLGESIMASQWHERLLVIRDRLNTLNVPSQAISEPEAVGLEVSVPIA